MRRSAPYFGLFLLALGVRFAYLLYTREYDRDVSAEMERSAVSLADNGALADSFGEGSGKSTHVAPLYPLLLSGIYRLWGSGTTGLLVQALLMSAVSALGIALLPALARRLRLPEGAGWLAGVGMALLPVNLWLETSGTWEQPLAALLLMGLVVLFARLEEQDYGGVWPALLAGALSGVALLLHPAVVGAVVLMGLMGLLDRHGRRGRVVRAGGLMLLAALVVASPWIVRNYRVFGEFIPTRGNLGLELAVGNNDWADGRVFSIWFEERGQPSYVLHPYTHGGERDRLIAIGERAYMAEKMAEGWTWIRENPGRFGELTLRRLQLFWFPTPDLWESNVDGRLWRALLCSAISVLALLGLFRLVWLRHPFFGVLTGALLGPSLPYLITHVEARYRYPIFALSMLLASTLLVAVWQIIRGGTAPSAIPSREPVSASPSP